MQERHATIPGETSYCGINRVYGKTNGKRRKAKSCYSDLITGDYQQRVEASE